MHAQVSLAEKKRTKVLTEIVQPFALKTEKPEHAQRAAIAGKVPHSNAE